MRAFWLYLAISAACVKGNPVDSKFVGEGGSILIPQCGYTVTTVRGAEAPTASIEAFGSDPTPRLVHLGLVGDPQTSVVMQWRTADEVTRVSVVRYGEGASLTADQLTQTETGIQFAFTGSACLADGPGCPYRQHQVHLCGLKPDTVYSYQVGGRDSTAGADHFSPVYSFRTAPDIAVKPDAEVVMGFVGDSRGGYDVWQQLVGQLQQHMPDVVLFSGDAVTFGITQQEWEQFLAAGEPLFATAPVIFANGNHENNAVNFYSQFALPGDQQNFGVDLGYAHVTVANDTPDDPSAITGAFRDALSADLAAHANARWKVVMHHQPMYSASTRHGSSTTLQAAWQPLFDQYHVDLVLNGHDHDYEVSKPLVGMTVQATSDNATVYIVAGGAGAELYPNGSQFWTQYSESNYSAAILHVRRDQLTFDAFRPDGTAIPTGFSKSKP
jgi:hypothetical protein